MRINSADLQCRYLHAPGTEGNRSAFGRLLRECGFELSSLLPLERIVGLGWITPVLRVRLPESAFLSWRDYPLLSMSGVEKCPEADQWALALYARAMSSLPPLDRPAWWVHLLDDADDPLTQAVRANAFDPSRPDLLPQPFRHPRHNQQIKPWLDHFAYWQVFELADHLFSMTRTVLITDELTDPVGRSRGTSLRSVDARAQALKQRWDRRRSAFEWLSRMRTVLGAGVMPERSWREIDAALRAVADSLGLTPERMRHDIRDTLLVMWQDWTGRFSPLTRRHGRLLELLRQEIEYAVVYLKAITERPVDFFDEFWYDPWQVNDWAQLIDALPREEELARREVPHIAVMYLSRYKDAIPQIGAIDESQFEQLMLTNWTRSRPLRRFVLALHRLHEQLAGERLMETEAIIRGAECIEQFNLVLMHAERVLSLEYRERRNSSKYPEVQGLAKDTLNHLLHRWSLPAAVTVVAKDRAKELLSQRAMLHDLDADKGLPFVFPEEIGTGCASADYAVAMLVNLVIARNYAAHHDAVDADLVYPTAGDTARHPGGVALTSAIGAVVSVLVADHPLYSAGGQKSQSLTCRDAHAPRGSS